MIISDAVATEILTAIQTLVNANIAPTHELKLLFFDGTTELADVVLDAYPNTILDAIKYNEGRFQGPGGLTVLAGTVHTAGTVDTFKLMRKFVSGVGIDEDLFTGSVGVLTSDADIRFTQTNWEASASIVLNNLTLLVPLEP